MTDSITTPNLTALVKALNSSLRLKDVLQAVVELFISTGKETKVAVFLSDNDSLSLKLMGGRGYEESTFEKLRTLSFSSETLLKHVVQKRQAVAISDIKQAPEISAAIMQKEGTRLQIGLPLIASNLLVGVLLIDTKDTTLASRMDSLKELADIAAQATANAILFGRSEYERERLSTLYKTSVSLSGSVLNVADVLRIAADTALILANTPHCAVLIADKEKQSFGLAAFKGLDGNSMNDFDLSFQQSVAGRCLSSLRTEYVADAANIQLVLPCSTGGGVFGSVVAIPIVHEQNPLGAIMLFSAEMRGFHREQIDLLEALAQQVGAALNVALAHESATSQTVQDAHTGLFNHRHFNETIGREIERSIRHKHEFAVLRVDIDHLSRVNELLGTGKGDEAIKHVAKTIKNCLRDIDIPCRYGSQEFVVILPETARNSAVEVAERVRAKIKGEAAPGVGMVTVSIGLASYPTNGEEPAGLLKAAEQALDVAKFEGRDCVKSASNLMVDQVSWEELANQARLAILGERQSKLQSRLSAPADYAPWMRAIPGWAGSKKKSD